MSVTQHEKAARFRALHDDPETFVIPNPVKQRCLGNKGVWNRYAGLAGETKVSGTGGNKGVRNRYAGLEKLDVAPRSDVNWTHYDISLPGSHCRVEGHDEGLLAGKII